MIGDRGATKAGANAVLEETLRSCGEDLLDPVIFP